MPRDGSGIYSKPFLDVVSGTTIESAVHNGTVSDIETDLNAARPIVAGGTGATSAADARNNLDAEVAAAQVTNYDSHVWETGSFWSQTSATGSPVAGHTYAGIAVIPNNDPNYITLRAVDLQNGDTYTRLKSGGLWGAWTSEQAANDARYVNITGDTMTGNLVVNATNASTSPTTGALIVAGGVGIGGDLYAGKIAAGAIGNPQPVNIYCSGNQSDGLMLRIHNNPSTPVNIIQGADLNLYICYNGATISGIDRTTGVYTAISDGRLKPNREIISQEYARKIVDAIEIYDYDKDGNTLRGVGVVAQQAHSVHASLGQPGITPDDYWMAEKAAPIPFMIANVQQLNQRLDALERQLKETR